MQRPKCRALVPPSAQAGWLQALRDHPRLLLLDDGCRTAEGERPTDKETGELLVPSESLSWPAADGVRLLGVPLGSPEYITEYLNDRLETHKKLPDFIVDVANAGHTREAVSMLTQGAIPRLRFLAKCLPRTPEADDWLDAVDRANLATWLACLGAPADLLEAPGGLTDDEQDNLMS